MKYTIKHPDVEAVRWMGNNSAEILAFDERLTGKGNVFWMPGDVLGGYFLLHKFDYLVRHQDGRLESISEVPFLKTYKPVEES